jgi:hypothetical protein
VAGAGEKLKETNNRSDSRLEFQFLCKLSVVIDTTAFAASAEGAGGVQDNSPPPNLHLLIKITKNANKKTRRRPNGDSKN